MPFERPGVSARIAVFLFLFVLASGTRQRARAQTSAGEYQIKAAFLFHFTQFVGWPPGALSGADTAINFCMFEDEPRRQELQTALEGKPIGSRIVRVRLLSRAPETQQCNVLFLSHDEVWRQTTTLKTLRGLPVLTVGETSNFLAEGGMIRFHVDEDRVRFDINLEAADSSHLTISSRLLLLASVVIRGGGMDRGR